MGSKSSPYSLDISQLIDLAKSDPQAFESERQAALDYFFDNADEDNAMRLRGIQWRIDRERELSANPMDACVRLNSMMWHLFSGEGGLVSLLNNPEQVKAYSIKRSGSSKVVPFKS